MAQLSFDSSSLTRQIEGFSFVRSLFSMRKGLPATDLISLILCLLVGVDTRKVEACGTPPRWRGRARGSAWQCRGFRVSVSSQGTHPLTQRLPTILPKSVLRDSFVCLQVTDLNFLM